MISDSSAASQCSTPASHKLPTKVFFSTKTTRQAFVTQENMLAFPQAELTVKGQGDEVEVTADSFARCVELSGVSEDNFLNHPVFQHMKYPDCNGSFYVFCRIVYPP